MATLCLGTQIHAFETKTRDEISDPLFSSMLDPEECYPTAKALGDVGIFEDRPYRGAGIKIGIIDEGTPSLWHPMEQVLRHTAKHIIRIQKRWRTFSQLSLVKRHSILPERKILPSQNVLIGSLRKNTLMS